MASIRLIATDLDGTFLCDVKTPHPENVRAMRACQEAGLPVCVLTGRNRTEAKTIVKGVGFDRFCSINNGTAILDTHTQQLRYRNRFHPSAVGRLIEWACGLDDVRFCLTGTFYNYQLRGRKITGFLNALQPYLESDAQTPAKLYDSPEELNEQSAKDAQRLFVQLPYSDEKLRRQVYETVNNIVPADITSSGDDGMEFIPKGASKADTLRVLADIYNVRLENIIAIGNSINDIPMLQAAGMGVAMANADKELLGIADYIAPDNVAGGFAKVIWRMVL